MGWRTVSVDVDIDEFDDSALIDEVIERKLVAAIVAKAAGKEPPKEFKERTHVCNAINDLVVKRPASAKAELRKVIAHLVPPQIVEALDAINDGRIDDAINELDRYIDPAPSATATKLPVSVP